MGLTAYALRADFEDNYLGGLCAIGTGEVDVKAALDQGSGVIVVDDNDAELVAFLDTYPPLKRTELAEKAEPTVRRYDLLDAAGLRAEANRRGLKGAGSASSEGIGVALRRQDAALAKGDLAAADKVTIGSAPKSATPKTKSEA